MAANRIASRIDHVVVGSENDSIIETIMDIKSNVILPVYFIVPTPTNNDIFSISSQLNYKDIEDTSSFK
jgi:hypothetical protein